MIEMGTKRREPAKEIADIRSRLDHLQSRIGGEDGDAGAIGQVEPRLGIEQISREPPGPLASERSEEHTSELQSLMRISYAVFCLKKKKTTQKEQKKTLYTKHR